jgi:hypothetical protein
LTAANESCSVAHMSQSEPSLPLTRFLTALSHSPELLRAFSDNRIGTAKAWGVTDQDQLDALQSGKLDQIQAAVNAEVNPLNATATVGWWIMVEEDAEDRGGGLPDWWIRHF